MFPSHVLVVGAPRSGKLKVCKQFAEIDLEVQPSDSHSGLIFPFELSTPYYKVNGKFLVDEYPETRDSTVSKNENEDILASLQAWTAEFTSKEAKELRDYLEGLVFCIDGTSSSQHSIERTLAELDTIRSILDEESEDGMWPGFLVVASPDDTNATAVEDASILNGFEFINLSSSGVNEFKDKIGRDRLKEILETHEWKQMERKKKAQSTDTANKEDKISSLGMAVPLLQGTSDDEEADEDNIDFSAILEKLNVAKEEIQSMKQDERREFANKIVADVMDYI